MSQVERSGAEKNASEEIETPKIRLEEARAELHLLVDRLFDGPVGAGYSDVINALNKAMYIKAEVGDGIGALSGSEVKDSKIVNVFRGSKLKSNE